MKIRTIVTNGIVAALYIAVTAVIQPIAFSNIQFRIPEMFNHLVIFNKKYFFGVVIGVFFANLFFSNMLPYDLIFGVFHSIVSLAITLLVTKWMKNIWMKLIANTIIFSFMMFIIAYELKLALGFPFWESWLFTAVGEFVVMAAGAPLMYVIDKRIQFKNKL
ncbi:QueT transporter family protein [Fervidibacillus halotolerans]|uniref:QueT transporter family protein n=1 Tax=Fervidibacillus halotolerans TaxID=2980027 RepID=A0A9E8LZK4_9BACI|nr:QueT transporter family protein [Fervidibacillus halotolerans]WAA12733.1 QueT transporter family protein [Fervidibacillus halotolerans]